MIFVIKAIDIVYRSEVKIISDIGNTPILNEDGVRNRRLTI